MCGLWLLSTDTRTVQSGVNTIHLFICEIQWRTNETKKKTANQQWGNGTQFIAIFLFAFILPLFFAHFTFSRVCGASECTQTCILNLNVLRNSIFTHFFIRNQSKPKYASAICVAIQSLDECLCVLELRPHWIRWQQMQASILKTIK